MIRSTGIVLLLAIATMGDGGASAPSLLAQHVLLAAVALLALASGRGGSSRLPGSVVLPFVGFLALAGAGAMLAPYAYAAGLVLVELAAFSFVAWLSASVGTPLLPRVAVGATAVALAQSIAAIGERLAGTLRPDAGFLNPNHLSAWLVAVMLLAVGTLWPKGRAGRFACVALLALGLTVLVVIGSRAAALGWVAGIGVALALSPPGWIRARRRAVLGALGLLVLASLVGVGMRFRVSDPFGLARISIWRASLGALAGDPLWGAKPGQFETLAPNLNFPVEGAPLRYERTFQSPHSDLLRAPAEFGLPATAALILATGAALAALRRRAAAGLSTGELGALAALGALVAQGAVNDLTESPAIYLLAAALAGALLAEPSRGTSPAPARLPRVAAATALLAALVAFEVQPYRAWSIQQRLPRGALAPGERADLRRAIALNPWQPDLRIRDVADRLTRAPSWRAEDYAAAREAAETAVRLNPAAAAAWSALAHVEGSGCIHLFRDVASRERAAHAFVTAAGLSRHDPFIPLDAARFLLAAGDPAGARRHAERALALEPNAVAPRLVLARAIERQGDAGAEERALSLRSEAEALARRFADVPKESPYALGLLTLDAPAGGD